MPGVNSPFQDGMATAQADVLRRLAAIERQQQLLFTDSGSNPRVQIGLLPDGTFGFALYNRNNDGGYVVLNDPLFAELPGPFTTSSTTFTTIAGSPTLPIVVGGSGKCLVTLSAFIGLSLTAAGTAQGNAVLTVDGVQEGTVITSSLTLPGSGGTGCTDSSQFLLEGLSQGDHTLGIVYQSRFGQPANFSNVSIAAQPY